MDEGGREKEGGGGRRQEQEGERRKPAKPRAIRREDEELGGSWRGGMRDEQERKRYKYLSACRIALQTYHRYTNKA